jgi:hypothetical protein
MVRHLRQILLWPFEIVPAQADAQIQTPWERLAVPGSAWSELQDEFTGDDEQFQERHYAEFVTFLPYVQRLLYGEGRGGGRESGESPIRVFRRRGVARTRLTFPDAGDAIELDVVHVDLYFFYDLDVAVLAVELGADDLPLPVVQETLYRFGRTFPTHWGAKGEGGHCLARAEWLADDGTVLAVSDYEHREKFLAHVNRYRAPAIASHWQFLLTPMVPHHTDLPGAIRYRQIEYHRMPLLAYLAVDDPARLTRADFVRLLFVTPSGDPDALPFSASHVADFEATHCYDRYWDGRAGTRYLSSGEAFVMVGHADDPYFSGAETGLLAHFRHQLFLLFLIPHFQKAALVMLSDRLVDALNRLNIRDPESVKRFKRRIRQIKEIFLRFTHRYWFHEVSDQAQARAMHRRTQDFLGTERLFAELREEIEDMAQYLDSDSLRRQANMVIRLTVVTTFGLIGTIATGFLGMNLIAAADTPLSRKLLYFVLVVIPTTAVTLYSIVKSKRLSDFLEVLADERLSARTKLGAFLDVWGRRRRRAQRRAAARMPSTRA